MIKNSKYDHKPDSNSATFAECFGYKSSSDMVGEKLFSEVGTVTLQRKVEVVSIKLEKFIGQDILNKTIIDATNYRRVRKND